jgi:hypothetical protein
VLWLRPESAIWYSHMLTIAKKNIGILKSPSMEFGCMDGLNSFLVFGGEIDEAYDVFSEAVWNDNSHLDATLKNDYFDIYNDQFKLPITRFPDVRIDFAVDWKKSHVLKSKRMGLYENVDLIDIRNPYFPITDALLETIWAPNLYWAPEVSKILKEFDRVMRNEGRLLTILPDRSQINHMVYNFADRAPKSWLKLIDRGRYENVLNNGKSLSEWANLFSENGFEISRHEKFIPDIVARAYDIGFRPMFSVLLDIHQILGKYSSDELNSWKKFWIEEIATLSKPFVNTDWYEKSGTTYDWHFFELIKR